MSEMPELWYSPSVAKAAKSVDPCAGMIWRHETGRGYVCPRDLPADAVRVFVESDPAPIDWPARFRAAAEAVEANGRWPITAQHFDDVADRLESGLLPPHLVEAIGRALLGQEEK